MKLMDGFDSNYRYILVAARRARQLQGGAPPVIETLSRKPCRIAQDEIKAGKVKWVIPEIPKSAAEAASEMLDKAIYESRTRRRRRNCSVQSGRDCSSAARTRNPGSSRYDRSGSGIHQAAYLRCTFGRESHYRHVRRIRH